jgi:sporadic carbohydrate cluster 2OG-Fe(II) oxygenase
MFLTKKEKKLTVEYMQQGHIILSVANNSSLKWISNYILDLSKKELGDNILQTSSNHFNMIHEHVSLNKLNDFRLNIINGINSNSEFRKHYYQLARPYLEALVGNELAMQQRVNLSIQFPQDDSSLLPVHADTWSGDSPFEVVVWTPLVDCYGSKSMYILPPKQNSKLEIALPKRGGNSSEDLYRSISDEVLWLEVKYGEVLIFNQTLPHGNRVNKEKETRWSMNCRFKSLFTPYADKKLGEFFEPVTLRAVSKLGMEYKLPNVL